MGVTSKIFTLAGLLAITIAVIADEDKSVTDPYQRRILNQNFTKMQTVIDALEQKVAYCADLSGKRSLSPSLFNNMDLPIEDWITVFSYFSFRAQHHCEGDELWSSAVMALNRFKWLEKYYTGSNMRETRYRRGNFCCGIWETELSLELAYLKIPREVREKLDGIAELQEPFDMLNIVETMKSLQGRGKL